MYSKNVRYWQTIYGKEIPQQIYDNGLKQRNIVKNKKKFWAKN
jgi:hypothetical protein